MIARSSFFSMLKKNLVAEDQGAAKGMEKFREASVLVPLIDDGKEVSVLLSKRTEYVPHHKGQVCFPGGSKDEGDSSLLHTALRESEEELGIREEDVALLGPMQPVPTMTRFIITPYVGAIPPDTAFTCNGFEVEEVFTAPLSIFLDLGRYRKTETYKGGTSHHVYFFDYQDRTIWGATAKILRNMAGLIIAKDLGRYLPSIIQSSTDP